MAAPHSGAEATMMTTRATQRQHRFLRWVAAWAVLASLVAGCGTSEDGSGSAEVVGASLSAVGEGPAAASLPPRERAPVGRVATAEPEPDSPVDVETSLPPGSDLVLPVDDAMVQVRLDNRGAEELELEPVLVWRNADGEQQEVLERTRLGRGEDRVLEIDLDRPIDTSESAARVDVWVRIWVRGRGQQERLGGSVFFRREAAGVIRAYDEQGRRQRHRGEGADASDPEGDTAS